MRNHIDNFTASLGKRYKERSRPRCAANVQRRPGPQWLPRIGNNHGLVMARLRFDALSIHAGPCHVQMSKNVSEVRGVAMTRDFVAVTVAVEEASLC